MESNDDLLTRAIEHHAAIRKMVAELYSTAEPSKVQLEAFANLLEEHIRFEERTLFLHIEKQFSNETMAAIGNELQLIHSKQQPLHWNDEFWIRK
jgi:hemerythrin-like domain-containing protein